MADYPRKLDLTERQARFVYEGARLAAQAAQAPIIPVVWEEREEQFRAQFRYVIERQCGDQRSSSPEELHGTLSASFRRTNAVFVALCEIARQWVYEDLQVYLSSPEADDD
jgi:hypothetical protein